MRDVKGFGADEIRPARPPPREPAVPAAIASVEGSPAEFAEYAACVRSARTQASTVPSLTAVALAQLHRVVQPVAFTASVRFWNEGKRSGLAVVDVPDEHVAELGGLRQQQVHGRLNDVPFTSNVMPAGGGRLAMTVSKALLKAAGIAPGDGAEVRIERVGRDQ